MTAPETLPAPKKVTDEAGRLYELCDHLGAGGQGSVFLCKGGKLAAKFLQAPGANARERLRKQIALVRRLPLSELYLAKPIALLAEPHAGYVMEFMSGMVPLAGMCAIPSSNVTSWHLTSGSLRRRLRLLGALADRVHQLHSRGLIYGDLSPANVFISKDHNAAEVWLIDCDNICYASSPCSSTYFTPQYGAPELVRGRSGFTTLSDAYAFAVMVYKILTLTHPLIGRAVSEGAPEEELAALRGERPWVESPEDDTNHSGFGIQPTAKVLSPRLKGLCEETFGAGLNDPRTRPGLRKWRDFLHWADAATVTCVSCGGTFYRTEAKCPWCNAGRPSHLLVTLVNVLPELRSFRDEIADGFGVSKEALPKNDAQPLGQLVVSAGEDRIVSDFHLAAGDPGIGRISISFTKGAVRLANTSCDDLHVAHEGRWRSLKTAGTAQFRLTPGQGLIAARYGNMTSRHIALKVSSVEGMQ